MTTPARLLLITNLLRFSCDSVSLYKMIRPYCLTYLVRKPLLVHLSWIPNVTREVRGLLIHIDKFNQLRIQMWVPKGPIHHQRIVEMFWSVGVVLESVEMHKLCLQNTSQLSN